MNGARIRSYSLAGTRPSNTSRSVPRLIAPNRARTFTSPPDGGATASSRNSARFFATYQSTFDAMPAPKISAPEMSAIEVHAERHARDRQFELYRYLQMKAMLEGTSPIVIDAPPAGRRILFFSLSGLSMAGMIGLSVYALSAGGFG